MVWTYWVWTEVEGLCWPKVIELAPRTSAHPPVVPPQPANRMLPHSPSKAEESGEPALSALAVTLVQVMVMVMLGVCHTPRMGALPIFTGLKPL